jgi:DNA-binding IclR family transcriptional regulator
VHPYTFGVATDRSRLGFLVQTLAWMGGNRAWPADVIAEQIGEFDDPRVHRHLQEAAEAGLVSREDDGYRLTDDGWGLAADMS